jgi:hypothetical protein
VGTRGFNERTNYHATEVRLCLDACVSLLAVATEPSPRKHAVNVKGLRAESRFAIVASVEMTMNLILYMAIRLRN